MSFSFSLLFFFIGVLLVALAIPLIRRRVKPNAFYGLRVPATFSDPEVWYEANARSGWDFVYLGCAQIVVAVGLALIPELSPEVYVFANVGVLLVGVVCSAIIGWRRANRLLRERRGAQTAV